MGSDRETPDRDAPGRDAPESGASGGAAGRMARLDRGIVDAAPMVLRLGAALLWLTNVGWKVPPDFGRSADGCRGLCGFVGAGADSGIIPPWQWLSEHVLVPNLIVFGWTVLILEFLLSASFVSGRFTRIAAIVGFAQSLAIGMSVANADGEWYWSYALMALLHVAVFATATRVRTGEVDRRIVALGLAGYAVVLGIANARNDLAPSDFTRDFVLFGGPTDFPGDFGRNLFAGSLALAVVLVAVAAATWFVGRRPAGRIVGIVSVALGVIGLFAYRADGNVLAARPAPLAILAGVGIWLIVTTTGRSLHRGTSRSAHGLERTRHERGAGRSTAELIGQTLPSSG